MVYPTGKRVRDIHISPQSKKWSVRYTGSTRAFRTFGSKDDAIGFARERRSVQNAQIFVHSTSGFINEVL